MTLRSRATPTRPMLENASATAAKQHVRGRLEDVSPLLTDGSVQSITMESAIVEAHSYSSKLATPEGGSAVTANAGKLDGSMPYRSHTDYWPLWTRGSMGVVIANKRMRNH